MGVGSVTTGTRLFVCQVKITLVRFGSFCRASTSAGRAATLRVRALISLPLHSPPALPFKHSAVHLLAHASFQAGTRCGTEQTARRQASAQASRAEAPQTVTQEPRLGSRLSPSSLRNRRSEAHTRSQAKPGSREPSRSKAPSLLLLLFGGAGGSV